MRHVLVKLALIGFLCRALVPAGFMPAPLADGGPIRFCHGDAAGPLVAALVGWRSSDAARSGAHDQGDLPQLVSSSDRSVGGSEHAGHVDSGELDHGRHSDDEPGANHEGWDRCPVGTAFALAGIVADFTLPLLSLAHAYEGSGTDLPVARLLPAHYHARAPPRV